MQFTDIFIRRPVFASVISLFIFLIGFTTLDKLTLRQFPKLERTVIEVTTSYPGASADLVQGFITTPLQNAIATADGIEFITSESHLGQSRIKAHVKMEINPDPVFTDILANVTAIRNDLPRGSEMPVILKETGKEFANMYLSFTSQNMSNEQITDYVKRVVQPKLTTILGVSEAEVLGASNFAIRVWLDNSKLAALHISPQQVTTAIADNNYQATPGTLKGAYTLTNIHANTDLHTVSEFQQLILGQFNGALVRLQDVATVELGSEDDSLAVAFNGKNAVFIGIKTTPSANPLEVIAAVKQALPKIQQDFPQGLQLTVAYDGTRYIADAIQEVKHTIIEASLIVILVIFLFLGSMRTVTIPMVTIPLSLIGVCAWLYAMGYSINLLTLLAMILAIGLVVDDAIVVVENIYRHIEEGKRPFDAAIIGAREIVLPIIAMTITLAAVYAPIMLAQGLTGALFSEFAFTLAATVIISGFLALTLSPMMCSKLLRADISEQYFVQIIDRLFVRIRVSYQQLLHRVLDHRGWVLLMTVILLGISVGLFKLSPQELAPDEDPGFIQVIANAPKHANFHYLTHFTKQFQSIYESIPEVANTFLINGAGSENFAFSGVILKPIADRDRSSKQIQPELQAKLDNVAGLRIMSFVESSLPGLSGPPLEFSLNSVQNYKIIKAAATTMIEQAMQSGLFMFLHDDLDFNMPQLEILVDRNKASQLGLTMKSVSDALAAALGANYVSRFAIDGRSYKVIPQLQRKQRLSKQDVAQIKLKANNDVMIPLAAIATIEESVQPTSLNQLQQLNAIKISGALNPGVSTGQAIHYINSLAKQTLPENVHLEYQGQMLSFLQEGHTLRNVFLLACLVIFLILAAQFESYSDPLIILISAPMAICGGLIPLALGWGSLNIYTEIGLLTLIGLISKAGILIVDFANKLRDQEGLTLRAAIEKSAALRLRPILMTTIAMVVGVLPLILAGGAGSVSRNQLGLVIAFGMIIGTLFSLFVVPTFYTLFARRHR